MVLASPEVQKRVLLERLALNHGLLSNKYHYFPVDDTGHESYSPVGRGVRSSILCGRYAGVSVCKKVDLHKGVHVHGIDCTGKVLVRLRHIWCNKSSCPVCFLRGWSVREARRLTSRVEEGERLGFGKIEHIVVSVSPLDYNLSGDALKVKTRSALSVRGVTGGAMVFHGFRLDRGGGVLKWGAHFHVLGYIRGGFDVCRDCVHGRDDCAACPQFKGREVREFKKDGYLVKVLAERKTIFGSAHYELNHATIRNGVKRSHVVTYFGVLGYRKLKAPRVRARALCPACLNEMTRSIHVGKRRIVKDIGNAWYVPWFVDDEFDGEEPNYIDAGGGGFG
jgi:hypothetical protein